MHDTPLLTSAQLVALQERILTRHTLRDQRAASDQTGPHPAWQRGLGLELYESRPYRAGDDPRHVDWRATARSGRPMSKVFRAERERSVFLIVDRAPSMAFGTRGSLKATAAATAAAILAFSALADHETVAGAVLDESLRLFDAARSAERCLPLLQASAAALAHMRVHNAHPLDHAASYALLERAIPKRAAAYLISDFQFLTADQASRLAQLAARCTLTAILVSDPAEHALSDSGRLRLRAPTGELVVIDSSNEALRRGYAQQMEQWFAATRQRLLRAGLRVADLNTGSDPFTQLQRYA